jgi:hypothetical protein
VKLAAACHEAGLFFIIKRGGFLDRRRHVVGATDISKRKHIMLQHSEIKQRFGIIERNIEEAVATCKTDAKLPQKLKDCVMQWQQHAVQAKPTFDSQNNKEILVCVDDLERIGERAELALRDVTGDDSKIRNFVEHAHTELSDLKKKLH